MEIPTLKAEQRQVAGSRAAARLRRAGKLPAIVYGHQRDPEPVTLDYHDVELQIQHGSHVVNLDLQGRVQPCLLKDAQYDHLGVKLLHMDLTRVDLNERVTVSVPVELRGTPKGVSESGGVLRQELVDLELECPVIAIPERIRVDVSHLELDDVLHVRDVPLDAGFAAMNDPETVVATVRPPQVEAAPAPVAEEGETAAGAEPEVIAKGKEEKEEGGEG